jgi:hypothetical protein
MIYFILLTAVLIEMIFRPRLLSYKGGCELAYGINKRKYKKLW